MNSAGMAQAQDETKHENEKSKKQGYTRQGKAIQIQDKGCSTEIRKRQIQDPPPRKKCTFILRFRQLFLVKLVNWEGFVFLH
jgi:hypothetical protein